MRCTVILPGALTFRSFSNLIQQTDVHAFSLKGQLEERGRRTNDTQQQASKQEALAADDRGEYRVLSSECKKRICVLARCNDSVCTYAFKFKVRTGYFSEYRLSMPRFCLSHAAGPAYSDVACLMKRSNERGRVFIEGFVLRKMAIVVWPFAFWCGRPNCK